MAFMFVDHVGVMIFSSGIFPWASAFYLPSRILGRIAFPLFAFMVVEAIEYSKKIQLYWLRLVSMAFLIGVAMWFLSTQLGFTLFSGNIFIDLLLGALFLYGLQNPRFSFLLLILPLYLWFENILPTFLRADYGTYGWLLMLLFWMGKKFSSFLFPSLPSPMRFSISAGLLFLMIHLFWFGVATMSGNPIPVQVYALLATPFILFYNGLPGHQSTFFRWFTYGFYPLHFVVIYAILLGLMLFY